MATKAPIILPVAASLAAFVLVLLALFSGLGQPVFIEDLSIIRVNTSSLGKNLLTDSSNAPSTTSNQFCRDGSGFRFGHGCASATAAVATAIASALGDVEDNVADELAKALGIKQFYSLHTMNACEGYFAPNATANGASLNVTSCTSPFSGYNVTATIDYELSVGPLKLRLADLGFNDPQQQLNTLYRLFEAFGIVFLVGVALVGLSFSASAASFVLIPHQERAALLANVILSAASMIILSIAATGLTVSAYVGASKITEKGSDLGVYAEAGRVFTAVVWAAVGLMIVTFTYWVVRRRRFKKGKPINAKRLSKHVQMSEENYSPTIPASDEGSRETQPRVRTRQPAPVRDRWGRFHEGSSWNTLPSRISFLSGRSGRRGGTQS
ncbi:hypothetical protein GQ53DRAFT_641962 [Thozetella sp. PMI_491]|nr:hypothetical protein GQ53DRAFT_641962 [Thozetella sp. PMI_491]